MTEQLMRSSSASPLHLVTVKSGLSLSRHHLSYDVRTGSAGRASTHLVSAAISKTVPLERS